jgi:hypothetical protein
MKNKYEIRGNIVSVFLNRADGSVIETIIDKDDLPRMQEFKGRWSAYWSEGTKSFYVRSNKLMSGNVGYYALHRWINNCPEDLVVDHIDHDTLNNTKANLRNITHSENMQNRKACNSNSNTGFRGVSYRKSLNKWRAYIMINKKQIGLGVFDDPIKAAEAAQRARADLMTNYINY